jgi:ribosomal protein S18 acetylase RimI-like enzyme
MIEGLIIREATRNDLPALEWDGQFTHFRRLYAQAVRRAEEGEAVLWVAELPSIGLIGQLFVQLESYRNELADGHTRAYIYSFRVRPTYQGAGIGTSLMQTAETDLRRRGYHSITLNVGRDNPAARRFYERFGYTIVGDEPGRWSYLDHKGHRRHVHEPSWRMEKELKSLSSQRK